MRRVACALALLVVAGLPAGASVAGQSSRPAVPVDATLGPLVAGTASWVHGAYVWTDYAYDDHGPGGNVSYPSGRSNAADLVQLQLTPGRRALGVRAVLETLTDRRVPVLTLGLDLDGSPRTGAASVPGWPAAGALGVDRLVTVSSSGAVVSRFAGGRWQPVRRLRAVVDPAANVLATSVPVSLLPSGASRWRVVGGLSVAGGGPLMDLAFVGGEAPKGWQDTRQSAVLAGTAPASAAVAVLDLGAARRGVTRLVDVRTPGFHTLLYRSRLTLGEGVGQATLAGPGGRPVPVGNLYAGPYQPYLVWVPARLPVRPPVVVYMHGLSQTHTSNAGEFGAGRFDPAAVVAMPLGRGENTFYIGPAEQDVLDVVADAAARYRADRRRVVLSGLSMGGFGTFRLATRYPDRWAAAVAFIGTGGSAQYEFGAVPAAVRDRVFSPSGFPSGDAELLENLSALPMRMVNGQVDPIVNNVLVTQDASRLEALGYDYRYWVLLRRQHEVVPELSDCVLDEALRFVRRDPARVVYSVEPSTFLRDPGSGLDLRYDRAYWVSGVAVRRGVEKGTVDVTSLARSDRTVSASRVFSVGQNVTAGADLCGPRESVHTGDAWREQGTVLRPGSRPAVSNGLVARLSGVSSFGLDLARMRLSTRLPLVLRLAGDGPVRLRLVGPWRGAVTVVRDGVVVGRVAPRGGAVIVNVDAGGQRVVVLRPR